MSWFNLFTSNSKYKIKTETTYTLTDGKDILKPTSSEKPERQLKRIKSILDNGNMISWNRLVYDGEYQKLWMDKIAKEVEHEQPNIFGGA
jgi:hypothetical protein